MKRYAVLIATLLFCGLAFASKPPGSTILVAATSQSPSRDRVTISWGNPDPNCSATSKPCTITYRIWRGYCKGCEQGVSIGVPFGETTSLSWTDTSVSASKATTFYYTVDAVETNGKKTVYSGESREVSVAMTRSGSSMAWVTFLLLAIGTSGTVLVAWATLRRLRPKTAT